MIFWNPVYYVLLFRGYRIMAIMCPCQGQETGPIPVTRSIKENADQKVGFFFDMIVGCRESDE